MVLFCWLFRCGGRRGSRPATRSWRRRIVWLVFAWTGLAALTAARGAELAAETDRPEMSTYALGEPVTLDIRATGIPAEAAGLVLNLRVLDAHDGTVTNARLAAVADSDGVWETEWSAPAGRLGFYRVALGLSDGTTTPARGSRPAGMVTYAVVPDPAERTLYPPDDSRFGMQGGFNPGINVVPYLGFRWIVGGFQWRRLEPEHPGQFAEAVAAARERGKPVYTGGGDQLHWYHVVRDGRREPWTLYPMAAPYCGQPDWAVDPEMRACATGVMNAEGRKAWPAYCRQVATVMQERFPDLPFRLYQITWEPNYPWGFKGTLDDLVDIYRLAYPVIHKVDPGARVIGVTYSGGYLSQWLDATRKLFDMGLGDYLDGVSIHGYSREPESMIDGLRRLHEVVREGAGRALPLYITEQGHATKDRREDEIVQARSLVRANLISLGENVAFNMTFYICDFAKEPGYGYYYNLHPERPHGAPAISPKPVVPAYAAMTFLLDGYHSAGPIEWLGDTAMGYACERGDDPLILALWDYGDTPREVAVPVGTDEVTLYDWMGNARTASAPDGMLPLTLGPEPVYVQGPARHIWGRAAVRALEIPAPRLGTHPGQSVTIEAVLHTDGAPLKGQLELDGPDAVLPRPLTQDIAVAPGESATVPFTVSLRPDVPLGNYPLRMQLVRGGRPVAADGLMLNVRPPIALEQIRPVLTGTGAFGLQVRLREVMNRPVSAQLTTRLEGVPETTSTRGVTLAPLAVTDVVCEDAGLDVPPQRRVPAMAQLTLDSGFSYAE
ncbi:MAG: hypothetical protein JW951_04880, partial [Lentisphaerae bacterium]|nr:hypothetical protein [Lentisphaerota bacterium]